jgi:flagellar hook-associated protein 1
VSLEITLQNAISGLQTSKTALQVISNNIANVNTEGYTRKVIDQSSRIIDGNGYGVEIANISRNVDQGVLKQLRTESGTLGKLQIREDFLSQLNTFFGRPSDDNSVSHKIAELASQFDALAVTPETAATQFLSVKAAQDVIVEIERMSDEVQRLRSIANSRLSETITDFNSKMNAVVDLNTDIIQFAASNISTAELEDQRDQAINALAEIMDISYFEKTDGSLTVYTGGGNTLIDGQKQALTYSPPSTMNAVLEYTKTSAVNYSGPSSADYPIGGIPGIFVGEVVGSSDITSNINDGSMKGLLDLRDTDLPALQAQLDELSEKLKEQINQVHNKGTGFPPPPTLTGDNFVTTATNIDTATGIVIIGVVDENGNQVETEFIDLSTLTDVASLLTDGTNGINDKFTNLTASVDASGHLVLSASGTNRVAINEMTSSMTGAGKSSTGFSDFFGMNNLYASDENFASYRSNHISNSSTSLITTGGTLQLSATGAAAQTVNYSANASLSDLATAINAATGYSSSVVADGDGFRLDITHDSAADFSVVETATGTFLSETGMRTDSRGISNRLDVRSDIVSNTFFISRGALQSNTFESATQTSATTDFSPGNLNIAAGTLSFTIDASTSASIAYATTDTLTTVAASINGDATLAAANITAEVVITGSNFQLKINDGESNNFWVTDSGGLSVATSQGISIGDGSVASELAAEFDTTITFQESPGRGGGLAQTNTTLTTYSSSILSYNSVQVSSIQRDLNFQENLTLELFSKHTSISGVNMDEELANMIVIEQAYLAAARMITTTQELFKVLTNMVG